MDLAFTVSYRFTIAGEELIRGIVLQIEEARALAFAPGGYVFVGDGRGEIKVFSWGGVAVENQDLLMES